MLMGAAFFVGSCGREVGLHDTTPFRAKGIGKGVGQCGTVEKP